MDNVRVIRDEDWRKARKSAFEWVQRGHQQYITARTLYWKHFLFQFALLGAHAMELYLKAFLIHKIGEYPIGTRGHWLDAIYLECMKYDTFFEDESLSSHFLLEKVPKEGQPELWCNYVEPLRYPELLVEKPTAFVVHYSSNSAGTCETLNCIAHFMHKTIPQPPHISGRGSVINELLAGRGYLDSLGQPENASEIIDLFLRHNRYFAPPTADQTI